MGNMSYCRFENTLRDLRDCYKHINDDLEESENEARDSLAHLCKKIVEVMER